MYKQDDDLYVVDNGRWKHNNEIVIQKRKFKEYTSMDKSTLVFDGKTSMEIATWATFPTIDEATKFTVAYIIKTECFGETVTSMDGLSEYSKIEKEHPDLIFKYMDKVVEQ